MSEHLFHPALLSDLLKLQREVDASASRLRSVFSRHRPSALELRPKLEAQIAHLENLRIKKTFKPAWIDRHDAARSLVEHGDEVIGMTEGLVEAMALIFEQDELGSEFDELRFPTGVVLQKLSAIRAKVNSLTPVHSRVQHHLALLTEEYSSKAHRSSASCTPLTWEFYSEMAEARDVFFEDGALAHLRDYLATVNKSLELERTLASNESDDEAMEGEGPAESAAAVYAELVRDELMLELLEGER